MNNEPVVLTQGDILGILQDANSVPLGQPIFNSSEEYNKLKAIIESAIRYTYPAETITLAELRKTELYRTEQTRSLREFLEPKELTDEEIWDFIEKHMGVTFLGRCYRQSQFNMCKAILRKAQEQ
jgi:hypothetical protein